MDAVVTVTVIHVLLCVLHACMLRECDGARLAAMLVWGDGWGVEVSVYCSWQKSVYLR